MRHVTSRERSSETSHVLWHIAITELRTIPEERTIPELRAVPWSISLDIDQNLSPPVSLKFRGAYLLFSYGLHFSFRRKESVH